MSVPTMLGFPLWRGRIKRRVAKKYLRIYHNAWMLRPRKQALAKLGVGDFVNDCTGMNGRITELRAAYRRIGKGRGAILLDVDLQTENTGCSLCHCGIEPKVPREEVESRAVGFLRAWTLGDSGKHWYGGENSPKYIEAAERAQRIVAVVEQGGHVTDEDGRWLPEYAR